MEPLEEMNDEDSPSMPLKFHEFELVPKHRETYTLGFSTNPDLNTIVTK